MRKCDCWVGILNDYDQSDMNNLHLSNVVERLNERSQHSFDIARIYDSNSNNYYKPKDYIDKRRGLATLFNFCPNCGTKINWKELRDLCYMESY